VLPDPLANGEHTVVAVQRDEAGNTSPESNEVTFTVVVAGSGGNGNGNGNGSGSGNGNSGTDPLPQTGTSASLLGLFAGLLLTLGGGAMLIR
ncbi:LPXTG cell wall anchor domain-containing protein, partial [Streptomyces sp. URMC 126]|uniref:LPXTG cell wall anchor domain-containing protein n=1 Tax=Streptomyces sp. URMC 126 TaxID=3423401 RepID=UPI003F196A8B